MVSVFKELIKVLFASVKPKSNIGSEKYTVSAATVAEPILSFVNTVKANPERFTFEGVVNERYVPSCEPIGSRHLIDEFVREFQADNGGWCDDLYKFTDKELGISWEVLIFNWEHWVMKRSQSVVKRRHITQPNFITCNDEKVQFVTQLEWLFIEEQLYLPFLERNKALAEAKQRRAGNNYERSCKKIQAQREVGLKAQREAYKKAYCKEEKVR